MITTAGMVRECIFDDMYEYACNMVDGTFQDDTFLSILYELDKKEEWVNEEAWAKANPKTFDINDFKNCYVIGGADISITTDLTCATLLLMDKDTHKRYIHQMYWFQLVTFIRE